MNALVAPFKPGDLVEVKKSYNRLFGVVKDIKYEHDVWRVTLHENNDGWLRYNEVTLVNNPSDIAKFRDWLKNFLESKQSHNSFDMRKYFDPIKFHPEARKVLSGYFIPSDFLVYSGPDIKNPKFKAPYDSKTIESEFLLKTGDFVKYHGGIALIETIRDNLVNVEAASVEISYDYFSLKKVCIDVLGKYLSHRV